MIHPTATVDRQRSEILVAAAAAAGHAPSILNTQPWHWRVEPGRLELFADRAGQLRATDPQGRLLMISCGAALHHARIALAATGWSARVARLPDAGQRDLLARLTVTGRRAVRDVATRLAQAIPVWHTDRRPVNDRPLSAASMDAIAGLPRHMPTTLACDLSFSEPESMAGGSSRRGDS